jgi:hypothetical protein
VCSIVCKTISELEYVILTTLFLADAKNTDNLSAVVACISNSDRQIDLTEGAGWTACPEPLCRIGVG